MAGKTQLKAASNAIQALSNMEFTQLIQDGHGQVGLDCNYRTCSCHLIVSSKDTKQSHLSSLNPSNRNVHKSTICRTPGERTSSRIVFPRSLSPTCRIKRDCSQHTSLTGAAKSAKWRPLTLTDRLPAPACFAGSSSTPAAPSQTHVLEKAHFGSS